MGIRGAAARRPTRRRPGRMTYDDDNRITTFNGTSTLGYDSDGNMTTGPLTNSSLVTYGYDARNQLTTAGAELRLRSCRKPRSP